MRLLQRISKRHWIAALLALSVISCLLEPQRLQWPRSLFSPVLAPLSHVGTAMASRMGNNLRGMVGGPASQADVDRVQSENKALRNRGDSFAMEIIALRKQLAEVGGWRDYFKSQNFSCQIIPATVIGGDATAYHKSWLLRPSGKTAPGALVTSRGLMVDQPTGLPTPVAVLSSTAVAGRIIESGAWTARMQTILDSDFSTDACVVRIIDDSRPRYVEVDEMVKGLKVPQARQLRPEDPLIPISIRGQGTDRMISAEVPAQHAIVAGDWVVTARNMGLLPANILIGRVTRLLPVAKNPNYVRLEVAPEVSIDSLRDVYIVMPQMGGGK